MKKIIYFMVFRYSMRFVVACLAFLFAVSASARGAVVLSEFIGAVPPTPQCHASTIVETPHGLLAAWFGGTHERAPDVGIWVSRKTDGGGWSRPREVATGRQADGSRLPTWNPVLFMPRGGPVLLFYKVGPDPAHWWGMEMTSVDDGRHWSVAKRLPPGLLGPIKDKPVQLPDGSIVSPSSNELGGWHIHFERSTDGGRTWRLAAPVGNPRHIAAIQPSLLYWGPHRLQAIGRSRQNRVFSNWSRDGGKHWSDLTLLSVRNPNSGIDAVRLRDGRALLVYNPTTHGKNWWNGRGTLAVALSRDGLHWRRVLTLEHTPGAEFSYPAVIQTHDGLVHIVYTWKRLRIKHVVLDPRRL